MSEGIEFLDKKRQLLKVTSDSMDKLERCIPSQSQYKKGWKRGLLNNNRRSGFSASWQFHASWSLQGQSEGALALYGSHCIAYTHSNLLHTLCLFATIYQLPFLQLSNAVCSPLPPIPPIEVTLEKSVRGSLKRNVATEQWTVPSFRYRCAFVDNARFWSGNVWMWHLMICLVSDSAGLEEIPS